MICVSLQNKSLSGILDILSRTDVEMAEIRLDSCPLSEEDIDELFSSVDKPLVATCRIGDGDFRIAESRLLRAIEAGAAYADLELEAPARMGKRIRAACDEHGTLLIRSYHDYLSTAPLVSLKHIAERCLSFGADIVKIVTTALSQADCATIMGLYDQTFPLIAFAMGEAGKRTRLSCLAFGAPFTYAALSADDAAAPGQIPLEEMRSALYGRSILASGLHSPKGQPLPMPSSKSFAQRAILAAALAEGTSRLSAYSPCGDNESAVAAARALGAEVTLEGDVLSVKGVAAHPGCFGIDRISAGESGLLARMLIPLMSLLNSRPTLVTGEKTLEGRPLSGAHDIMASFGVRLYQNELKPSVRNTDCCVPLTVSGPLIPGKAEVSGKGGSQLISGLLSALPLCDGKSTLYVDEPKSIPYMFITLDVLKRFGIEISSEMEGGDEFLESGDWSYCSAVTFRVKGGQRYKAASFPIEGDWSGAAPFLVAGAIFGEVEVSGLDTSSLQADISVMDVLIEAGAGISQDENGIVRVCKAPLRAFEVDLSNCPDLFPISAVLAAFSDGRSVLKGTDRLVHKETDRARAILETLGKMGVPARIEVESMIIEGMPLSRRLVTGNLLRGGDYRSWSDHRMAMALKVASLGADSPVNIDDSACLSKSFPGFLTLFGRLCL